MPQELPGFYYDPEKNRYFPIKGPVPGSHAPKPQSKPDQANDQNTLNRKGMGTAKLLKARELSGKVLSSSRVMYNFQHEFEKIQASQSVVWKYQSMEWIVDSALEHFQADMQTMEGQNKVDFLLMGSMRGSLSLYEVGGVGKHFDYGVTCKPDRIWPVTTERQTEFTRTPELIWRPSVPIGIPPISCIKRDRRHSLSADDGSAMQHALITTLGSETSGGLVYMMKVNEPLDFSRRRRLFEVAALNCTIWTADCNSNGPEAVVGTNLGAFLVNLDMQKVSWLCRSKSDVLSLQFNQLGNVVLCGFRNGVIATVDVRERQRGFSSALPRHQIPLQHISDKSLNRNARNPKKSFEVKGNIDPSCTTYMPSSISSLVSLETYDQYFLASSMDGSIKLYDHRMIQKGAVQSYEGQVNSHTRIQLGVDPSERFVISGGEDGKARIWSIKTGKLLFQREISDSVPTLACWLSAGKVQGFPMEGQSYRNNMYEQNDCWGAWLGSADGLYYIPGP